MIRDFSSISHGLNSYNIFKSLFTRMKDNNMSDFSINENAGNAESGKNAD